MTEPKRIAVIGGGLSGLAAAFRLTELAQERNQPFEITLIEASSRLGGIVGTERIGDYLVDVGADSFLTSKPAGVALCRRLGIEDRLIRTDARYRGALVLFKGRAIPIPEGFQLLSPTAIWPVITSPLFSISGKLRLLMEWFVPRRSAGQDDESLADFVRRRFGREALDRLIQPLVGGIYTSDPERLSLAATMPRFPEMERDWGSLIRASLLGKSNRASVAGQTVPMSQADKPDSSSGARYGQFAGLKGGIEDLVSALRAGVEMNCRVRLNTSVQSIQLAGEIRNESSKSGYRLTFSDGQSELFDGVIVATSATRAGKLLESINRQLSDDLSGIEYASSALVVTGHRLADVRNPLQAFGLVIPHVERRRILAVSFSSRKFPDRAPDGHVLLRTFVGGALQPELFDLSDDELFRIVREELSQMLGVGGEPDFVRIYRYPNAMPQYHLGHVSRVERIELAVRQVRGLGLAGNAYRGVGIPDSIASGEQSAQKLFDDLF